MSFSVLPILALKLSLVDVLVKTFCIPRHVLVGTCHPPSPRKNLSLLAVLAAGTNPAVPAAAVVAPL